MTKPPPSWEALSGSGIDHPALVSGKSLGGRAVLCGRQGDALPAERTARKVRREHHDSGIACSQSRVNMASVTAFGPRAFT